jgi:hypothetical protein
LEFHGPTLADAEIIREEILLPLLFLDVPPDYPRHEHFIARVEEVDVGVLAKDLAAHEDIQDAARVPLDGDECHQRGAHSIGIHAETDDNCTI